MATEAVEHSALNSGIHTECENRRNSSHYDGEVDGASLQAGPHAGGTTARAATAEKQAEPHQAGIGGFLRE